MEKIFNKMNFLWGGIVTLLSGVLGEYWYLFLCFLILNILDYITGILKAKYFGAENSVKGARGIVKKVGYWICIAVAFFVSVSLKEMGAHIEVDLAFTALFGWFTLAAFIINEIRSVLENLVMMEVPVPRFLIKGLEVAEKKVEVVLDEHN